MRATVSLNNVIAYITGNLRYFLYYSKWFKFLIRTHIREQIDFRIKFMDKACYENGQCVICGCSTTALQMADKACDKPCYPRMMTKQEWDNFANMDKYCKWFVDANYSWRYYKEDGDLFREDSEGNILCMGRTKNVG